MVALEYQYQFDYRELSDGSAPIVTLTLTRPESDEEIDVDAYLDSGASTSLFNGALISGLNLNLLDGRKMTFVATSGSGIEAYLHRVKITLPPVGTFHLDIGFSNGPISRNLLGRDFFNLVQLGFRENQRQYFLHPHP